MMMQNRQRGVSLLELLLVVGIAAVILLMATYFFGQTQSDTTVTKTVSLMQKISSASYEWLQAQDQKDFSGADADAGEAITTHKLIEAGLITPYDECTGVSCLLAPWGTPIETIPAPTGTVDSAGPRYIRIQLTGIPSPRMCKQLKEYMRSVTPVPSTTNPWCGAGGRTFHVDL